MKEPIEDILKRSLEGHELPFNPDAWSAMKSRLDTTASSGNGLEDVMKESLGQHEMPYNPAAWDVMKARLDQTTPVSYTKYYFAAAGITILAVASYFLLNTTTPTEQAQDTSSETELPITRMETASEATNTNTASDANSSALIADHSADVSNGSSQQTHSQEQENHAPSSSSENNSGNDHSSPSEASTTTSQQQNNPSDQTSTGNEQTGATPTGNDGPNDPSNDRVIQQDAKLIFPTVDNTCMGSAINIENKNNKTISIVQPNGQLFSIAANQVGQFTPTMTGMHMIGHMSDYKFVHETNFIVLESPRVDFVIDREHKYENGIPSTHVVTNSHGDSFTWKSGNTTLKGTEANFHFYRPGKHVIELEVANEQCSSTKQQSIEIEKYNLLAVTGFNPYDADPRKNTFMPYALTKRNINFRMIIIDGRDGGIVYETNDANKPWDGTDMRTGEVNSTITKYIWKVVLENPEPNEPAEYKGTITKL